MANHQSIPKRTFKSRMGCDNCGFIQNYEVPIGCFIVDAERRDDIYSSYHRKNKNELNLLFCDNCQTPQLRVFWSEGENFSESKAEVIN